MLISVIIPFYKEYDLIGCAVESALNQELNSIVGIEIIIVNDSPHCNEYLYNFIPHSPGSPIKLVKNKNPNGAGNARNAGIALARGDFFAFLDADDYWLPSKLKSQFDAIFNGYNFIVTSYKIAGNHHIIYPPRFLKSESDVYKNTNIGTSTVLISRDLLGRMTFSNIKFSQDTQLWASLANNANFKYCAVRDVGAVYRPSTRTANKFIQLINFCALVKNSNLTIFDKLDATLRYVIRGINNHFI